MKTTKCLSILLMVFVLPLLTAKLAFADARNFVLDETSLNALAEQSGLLTEAAKRGAGPHKVVVAVFDNGFFGYKEAIGQTLPSNTVYHAGPVPIAKDAEESHGLKMAEIVSDHLTRTGVQFDLHLYSAFGFSNLNHAVSQVIQQKPDLVLYPQVWEYGGNPDGTGFINQVVRRATDTGIKWINAAGNFGQNLYQAPVERVADDWAYLPGPNNSIQLRCHKNTSGTCRVRSVLSWSAFADDIKVGTAKDLDLVLTDDTLKVLQSAALSQKPTPNTGQVLAAGESLYPREILEINVKPGLYYLRVKMRSAGFTKSDFIRITTSGDFLEQLNRTEGESLLAPANLPSVITVGASDSKLSAASRTLMKPEFRLKSAVETRSTGGNENGIYKGSSNSSAAFTARAAFELSHQPKLSRNELVQVVRTGLRPVATVTSDTGNTQNVGLRPPGRLNCYPAAVLRITSPQIRSMLRAGNSWVVATEFGVAIVIDEDPLSRAARLQLPVESLAAENFKSSESILVAWADGTSYGLKKMWSSDREKLAGETQSPQPRFVEIVKAPTDFQVCSSRN